MKGLRPVAVLTAAATAVVLLLIATHAVPFGLAAVWTWQYVPLEAPPRALLPLVTLGLAAVALRPLVRRLLAGPTRRHEAQALLALCAATYALCLSVSLMHPLGFMQLATLVINPASNSYYSTALANPDLGHLLDNYDRKMNGLVSHAQTQSAGPVALCWVWHKVFVALPGQRDVADTLLALSPGVNCEYVQRLAARAWQVSLTPDEVAAALWIALKYMGIASLAAVPIYLLGKWLWSPLVGVWAAAAFALLPSFHSFTPSVDQMYPLFSTGLLCLMMMAVRAPARACLWLGAAGLALALSTFMNLGLLAMLPLCLVFWLLCLKRERAALGAQQLWVPLAAFVLCLLAPLVLLNAILHYNIIAVFQTSDRLRDELYMGKHRSYALSLIANLWDFFTFCGVPVVVLFGRHLVATVRRVGQGGVSVAAAPLLWSFVAVLIALDLSGKTRGEVARMWTFLMPCVLLGAAVAAQELTVDDAASTVPDGAAPPRWPVALLLAAQSAQVVVFQYYVRVWGY